MPIGNCPEIIFGSMPNDGGFLILNSSEKQELVDKDPASEKWIRPFMMGHDFLHNTERYCLWLEGITPKELKDMPLVMARVDKTRLARAKSKRAATRELSNTPTLFGEIRQPDKNYIAFPAVSSERREYIPIGYLNKDVIAGNKLFVIPDAKLYHFGIITSSVHMAWIRTVAGRLKSDYNYSAGIVYNNFPWPEPTDKQKEDIEKAAQAVLETRALFPDSSLAELYDPLTMPPELVKAHNNLDRAVMAAYGMKGMKSETEIVSLLMERYQQLVSRNQEE
jgi:hypothetical protein